MRLTPILRAQGTVRVLALTIGVAIALVGVQTGTASAAVVGGHESVSVAAGPTDGVDWRPFDGVDWRAHRRAPWRLNEGVDWTVSEGVDWRTNDGVDWRVLAGVESYSAS